MSKEVLNQNSNKLIQENKSQIANVRISDINPNSTQPRL